MIWLILVGVIASIVAVLILYYLFKIEAMVWKRTGEEVSQGLLDAMEKKIEVVMIDPESIRQLAVLVRHGKPIVFTSSDITGHTQVACKPEDIHITFNDAGAAVIKAKGRLASESFVPLSESLLTALEEEDPSELSLIKEELEEAVDIIKNPQKERERQMAREQMHDFMTSDKPRPEIMAFAMKMESVMASHDPDKGDSWKTMPMRDLQDKWMEEMAEARDTILVPDLINRKTRQEIILMYQGELLDVANVCMMIWNRIIEVLDEEIRAGGTSKNGLEEEDSKGGDSALSEGQAHLLKASQETIPGSSPVPHPTVPLDLSASMKLNDGIKPSDFLGNLDAVPRLHEIRIMSSTDPPEFNVMADISLVSILGAINTIHNQFNKVPHEIYLHLDDADYLIKDLYQTDEYDGKRLDRLFGIPVIVHQEPSWKGWALIKRHEEWTSEQVLAFIKLSKPVEYEMGDAK